MDVAPLSPPSLLGQDSEILRRNPVQISTFSPFLLPSFPPPFLHAGASAAAKYDAFVKWLLDNGARFPGLELRVRALGWHGKIERQEKREEKSLWRKMHNYCRHSFSSTPSLPHFPHSFAPSLPPFSQTQEYESDVRGVHAKEELNGDEMVVEIPLKCLITVEMGKETEIGKAVLASNLPLDAPKHIFLMLFMLTDRHNPSSFFKVRSRLFFLVIIIILPSSIFLASGGFLL